MRKHLLGLMLIAGLAGCSSESDVGSADGVTKTAGNESAPKPTSTSLAAQRESATSFASLPDRGALLAYGGARKVRQSGAYTWHPVAISEEHALNAIGTGKMVVNTPTGEALALQYERHEEQPDGNWTWVGRTADGGSAVLTFGQKAVFGTIARGHQLYRVRTDRSGAWVVEADASQVSGNGQPGSGTDMLIPPEGRELVAAATRQMAAQTSLTKAAGGGVIDLLLGYSSAIAAELGSQAAAVTLMSNLTAAANAAYASSGVTMRLRLVHAMPVEYADATSNAEALRQLTGYNEQTGQRITPNSAFNSLRASRDQFGADLVALVRRYRAPEQDGCGIAWLLGEGGSAISSADEAFGYAVVGDGADYDETDQSTYFCSNLSLAHELGHLMGQAHDRDNASHAGAHPYSYGYREAAAAGFYTIMAYPSGQSQVEIPLFANPGVSYAGRATGVANESDNVRSMNITMPAVAGFRATVLPVVGMQPRNFYSGDFNGDGASDILWRHGWNGQNGLWYSARGSFNALTTVADPSWTVVAVGDFNADGKSDIFWRHATTGENGIWYSGSSAFVALDTVRDMNWQVVGVGDFNRDGASDILWRHAANGQNGIWHSGRAPFTPLTTVADVNWQVGGVAAFNGDGSSDILWRHVANGQNGIWHSGTGPFVSLTTVADVGWQVVAVGDFNRDGASDIFWRHAENGQNGVWYSGSAPFVALSTVADTNWRVAGVGDFNGDGAADVLWRHDGNGENGMWYSGTGAFVALSPVTDLGWQVMPAR